MAPHGLNQFGIAGGDQAVGVAESGCLTVFIPGGAASWNVITRPGTEKQRNSYVSRLCALQCMALELQIGATSGRSMAAIRIDNVKAPCTTMHDNHATRGLVATTGRLASGARSYCEARQYKITVAEGENIKQRIRMMASHGE